MSLYGVQKLIYQLNRDRHTRQRFEVERDSLLDEFPLNEEELGAVREADIGLLYVLGVNGQLLMHYAALCGVAWDDYLEAMREGVRKHGPVREGVYVMSGYEGVAAHDAALRQRRAKTNPGAT
jgi:hypothetical protein